MHPFLGPWQIVKSLPGASYKLEFALNPSQKDKKACLQSLSYSPELMPFQPLDGVDSHYSWLYKPFGNHLMLEVIKVRSRTFSSLVAEYLVGGFMGW